MPSAFQRHQRANLSAPIGAGPVYPLKYVQAYLLDAQDLLTPSSMALGCLIAFDLVVLEDDLPLAYEALKSTHRYRSKPTIRWIQPPATADQSASTDAETSTQLKPDPINLAHDERTLSPFSWIACNQVVGDWLPYEQAQAELIEVMCREPIRRRLPRDWHRLLHSAQSYAHTYLPSAMRFHVLGQFRMVALTPAAAAREDSGLALGSRALDVQVEEAIANTEALLSKASLSVNQLVEPNPVEIGHERLMVEDLARACNAGRDLPPVGARSAVMLAIRALEIRLKDSHTWSRVLMLVALRMVQEGRLAMPSVGRYFSGSACRLYDAIHHLKFGQLKAKEVAECIEAALSHAEPSNKASVKVVGQGVLDLLIAQEVIDPVKLSRAEQSTWKPPVRAQVVWAHEVLRIDAWLGEAFRARPNDPILHMVRCVIGIAQATGMRVGEVLRVRIGNLSIQHGHVQFTIAPTRSDPTLKTKEGRRLTFIRDSRVIGYLLEMLRIRHGISFGDPHSIADLACVDTCSINTELASQEGMLFEDPHHQNEVWHEAQVRKWISIVLKAATGDPRSTLYDLRHTWVSLGNEQDFCLDHLSDDKPYDRRANELGHAPSDLMFTTYTHIFGTGIRACIDGQMMADQVLRPREISAWAAMDIKTMRREIDQGRLQQANDRLRTLVSRARRKDEHETSQLVLLRFIEEFSQTIAAPSPNVVYQIAMVLPTSPLIDYGPRELTLEVLLRCLRQLPLLSCGDGSQHSILARQAGVTSIEWRRALDELVFLNRTAAHVSQPPDQEADPPTWLIERHWGTLIDSAFTEKWTPLLRYLDRHAADPDVRLASEYVLRTLGCGDHIPVEAADARFESLVRVFKACGINLSRLALHASGEKKSLHAAKQAAAQIPNVLGIDVLPIARAQRSGRPDVYLTVRSQAGGAASNHNHDGSAHSPKGLSALFLGARLKAKMFEERRDAA